MISLSHQKLLFLVFILLLSLIIFDLSESAQQLSIVPGKSVAGYVIGEPYPASGRIKTGIKLIPGSGNYIEKIEVESSIYYLEGSLLRVKKNKKNDVIRFYGEPKGKTGSTVLSYPYQGIWFEIDQKTRYISKIIIFSPRIRTFQIKKEASEIYRQLYKQKN